jgi:hypothetical protein
VFPEGAPRQTELADVNHTGLFVVLSFLIQVLTYLIAGPFLPYPFWDKTASLGRTKLDPNAPSMKLQLSFLISFDYTPLSLQYLLARSTGYTRCVPPLHRRSLWTR